MAQAAARKRTSPAPASYARGRTENLLPPLRVSYFKQMRCQRVYQVKVAWQKSKVRPPADAEPIRVRLIMAGAQVIPSEQTLDPANPDSAAPFYVTPLAHGRLRAEHLEVLIQGRKVQEIALPVRVVTQRRTWVLFVLAWLLPLLIFSFVRPPEVGKLVNYTEYDFAPNVTKPSKLKLEKGIEKTLRESDDDSDDLYHVPGYITDAVPDMPKILMSVSIYATSAVSLLHGLTVDHPLELYVFAALLLLTLLSWWTRRVKRGRRTGKPIPLPRAEYA